MVQDLELVSLMQSIAEKSLEMLLQFKNQPEHLPALIEKYIELSTDFQGLIDALCKNPQQLWQMQSAYWQDAMGLAEAQFRFWLEGKHMPIADHRFSAKEWVENPFFNFMSQQYLLASEHINSLLEHLEFGDKQLARRVRFFSRQYLDALSPANFLTTNPQLIAETLQSHGKNLLTGLQNLLNDLEAGSSRLIIKMTDTAAFSIGKNIAATIGKVVFRNDLMELIQYSPATEKVYSVPLLIVPPWINKYYVLDLSENNSFVAYLVREGFTVFIISWVNPDASFAHKSFYDYLDEGPLRAIDIIKQQMQVKKVNTLGFCIGGTLLACALAYNKARKDSSIKSATFLASLIDFSDPGDLAVFIDELQVKRIEKQMRLSGFLDGRFMASTFNSLRANDLIWSFFIKNYLQGKDPVPFDILFWNADATNMPSTMQSQYLRWMYLNNDLIKPGKIHLNHVPLDMSKVDVPTFFVSTKKDHIAPWKTTYKGFQFIGGKKQFLLAGSGHIAGIVNPPLAQKYEYYLNESSNYQQSAEKWLKKASVHAGSWWPYWCLWLKKQSGKKTLPLAWEAMPFKPLVDAPGTYVLKTYPYAKLSSPLREG